MSTSRATGESYLVIGGCGFLGRHIVEALLGRGETEVNVFDIVQRHFDSYILPLHSGEKLIHDSNVTFYIGDLTKAEDVNNALQKSKASIIIHTASPNPELPMEILRRVNVDGTQTLLDCCVDSATVRKFVYTSSGGVVRDINHDVISGDERLDYPTANQENYNQTKAIAEKAVLSANSDRLLTCAIRPSAIFGPGDRTIWPRLYQVYKDGKSRWQMGDGNNIADATFVGNLAHAHLLAADKLDQSYPFDDFREPISSINLSVGVRRIPTSDARPLGPSTDPSEADLLADKRFRSGEYDPEDVRPVLRNRMDQFSAQASGDEPSTERLPIAGQAFFITNGEPLYLWDYFRAVQKALGDPKTKYYSIPSSIGIIFGAISEWIAKLRGAEPGLSRYAVTVACQNWYYDIERARRLLGYEPIAGMDQAIKITADAFKAEQDKKPQAGSEKVL